MNVAIKLNFLSLTDAPEDVFNFFQEWSHYASYIDKDKDIDENLFSTDPDTLLNEIREWGNDEFEFPDFIVAFYKDLETLPEYDDHTGYFRFEKF